MQVAMYSQAKSVKDYSKCPKIINTKVAGKTTYANNVDPDQTAPKGAV